MVRCCIEPAFCHYVRTSDGAMLHGTGESWELVAPIQPRHVRTIDGKVWRATGTRWERVLEAEVEVDEFSESWAEITLSLPPLLDRETITFRGPSIVEVYFEGVEGTAFDTDGNGLEQVSTQMVEMRLEGNSKVLGRIDLRLRGSTFGEIEETANLTTEELDLGSFGQPGTAVSYFDVLFKLELVSLHELIKSLVPNPLVLYNADPVRMTATIDDKPPPPGTPYLGNPVPLLRDDGIPVPVTIEACVHMPNPSPKVSARRWARAIWQYELPLCLTVCTRNRLCRGLVVELMLEKFETYLDSDVEIMTPLLHLDASIIKDFLERATPEEIEELACVFAEAYLEAEPCTQGSPCGQE